MPKTIRGPVGGAVKLAGSALLGTMLLFCTSSTAQQTGPRQRKFKVQDECTFSDGATISFGRSATRTQRGADAWQAGDYQATALRVSGRTIIPPMENPIEMVPGLYTLFIDPSKGEPWTLIISKRTPQPGMAYPGKEYDVGRTSMGFDDSSRPPVQGFAIGCGHWGTSGPMFVWMESGTHVAYAKIQTVNTAF